MTAAAPTLAAAGSEVRRGPPEPIGYALAIMLAVLAGGIAAAEAGPNATAVGLARAAADPCSTRRRASAHRR